MYKPSEQLENMPKTDGFEKVAAASLQHNPSARNLAKLFFYQHC